LEETEVIIRKLQSIHVYIGRPLTVFGAKGATGRDSYEKHFVVRNRNCSWHLLHVSERFGAVSKNQIPKPKPTPSEDTQPTPNGLNNRKSADMVDWLRGLEPESNKDLNMVRQRRKNK
jgi:hypothetical protein